ncbi:Hydantoinase/oxoprolinase [Rubrobacter xylanophilus DSM 9941]|uniref:Hydantoinase/oxoprolinase n=1 Tax=Rubrobacter xylanophilus (strain DSM 9941 / JCM 11954 / NBRC 16129 / PRD-1) TaxID=266117 RepID=Q1AUX3_RUBXD|nr:hydantoinase/oxoprolinase family protein [Rubrobacter xylanophilus]ABG04805.1 Hydantoinase/oxoprolinase [Rubrobacter xylanophilus DSM 9941]
MGRRYTVDIDIGGTLTDGLFSDGKRMWMAKVDTTPHDFTVCFFECLREGAGLTGHVDLSSFLGEVAVIRWSSTIATNVLAEKKGPRLGLLVSPGHEDDLYGEGKSSAIGHLVIPENITTVKDPENTEEVLAAIRALLERGVRRICVSLEGSFEQAEGERTIKRLVEKQFPDHYLGAVPTVLGSEICRHPDDMTRTHMSLINSYVHTPLAMALFKAEDELLSQYNYRRPVYIGHVNGGVARVSKTKGVDTTESGPVFGLVASAYFARRYGLDRVISLDVGGTTSKIGVVVNGEPVMSRETEFFGIPLKMPWILLRSVSLGGGSVARAKDGKVALGPDSMGAYPGPACYDLGGKNATLTDSFLISGMLNPQRFLGGRRHLSEERAREVLQEHLAGPLGVSVEEAARRVIEEANRIVEETIDRTLEEAGYTREGFTLFCFGGNGANFAASVADRMGLREAYIFEIGPVLSAFGSSVSDISHVYEEYPFLKVSDGTEKEVWSIIEKGRGRVLRDLEGEGLITADATLIAEVTVTNGRTRTLEFALEPEKARAALSEASSGIIERVAVRGVSPVPRVELREEPSRPYDAEPGDSRRVLGKEAGVYDWNDLSPGATVIGPAMLESETNTCHIADGWKLRIDSFGNAVLRKGEE